MSIINEFSSYATETKIVFIFAGIAGAAMLLAILFMLFKRKKVAYVLGVVSCVSVVALGCIVFYLATTSEPTVPEAPPVDLTEMVADYEENEIRAKEKYHENYYEVTATITKIEKAGLREAYVGYNVYLDYPIGNRTLHLCANYTKNAKEEILKMNVGDVLTFRGQCIAPELWYECETISIN